MTVQWLHDLYMLCHDNHRLWLHVLVVFHGFPMVAESPFDLLAVQPNPSTPTPANGSFSVTSRGYVYHQKKIAKTNIILICQLIHHDPCFTMIFQGVSGCFASIGLVNRCNAVPELGAWILCHPTSTTWQTGQICVCRKKKGSPCKHAQTYRTLLNIINYIQYHTIIYYWLWLRDITILNIHVRTYCNDQ